MLGSESICLLIVIAICGLTESRYSEIAVDGKPTDHAKVARYIVHKSNWGAVGTISTEPSIEGYPMVNIISIADSGRTDPSTGNIYFLLTLLDFTGKDLNASNKMTMMLSNDQNLECTINGIDPMEPTCARVMLTGQIVVLNNSSAEFQTANASFLDRHPSAVHWINTHSFYLCKLDIKQIAVLDWYGGPHFPTVEEYYNVKPDKMTPAEIGPYMQLPDQLAFLKSRGNGDFSILRKSRYIKL